MATNSPNSPKEAKQPRRSRARQSDGTYRGDNPETPLNEAWEATEVETGLEKEVKYTVKPKVTGTTNETTGKYSKKGAIRPTFGSVHTIQY
jgi:hypothetical protein